MLSREAKYLLEELKGNPSWQEIVDEIQFNGMPKYRPTKLDETSSDDQKNNWLYQSGRSFENDKILNTLNVKE